MRWKAEHCWSHRQRCHANDANAYVLRVNRRPLSSSFREEMRMTGQGYLGHFLDQSVNTLRERFLESRSQPSGWLVKTGILLHKQFRSYFLKMTTLGSKIFPSAPISEQALIYVGDGRYIEFTKTKSMPESVKKQRAIQKEVSLWSPVTAPHTINSGCFRRRATAR